MDVKEKKLYHQIHPAKLMTDWVTGIIALFLLWDHKLWIALAVMLIPAILITIWLMRFGELDKLKTSSFGTYIKRHMTNNMEVVRFAGFAIALIGAWLHSIILIVCGVAIILFGWLRGLIPGK